MNHLRESLSKLSDKEVKSLFFLLLQHPALNVGKIIFYIIFFGGGIYAYYFFKKNYYISFQIVKR